MDKIGNDTSRDDKGIHASHDITAYSTSPCASSSRSLDHVHITAGELNNEKEIDKVNADGDAVEAQMEQVQKSGTTASEKPYSAFGSLEKRMIVLCATLGGLFSPFTTNIYFPALDTISRDLSVTISQVNLTITTYMIFQAITPTFISAITDTQGRRPAYVIGFVIYMAANLGLGLNNSYAGLLVLRCLQSCGSSGMVTLQQAIIADVVTSAERGSYIAITGITGVVGPSVAPIIGGVLSQHLGWHSVFWFLLICSSVYLVVVIIFMPETSRKMVSDGSVLPPRYNMSLLSVLKTHRRRRNGAPSAHEKPIRAKRQKLKWPDPRPVLAVFADLECCLLLFLVAISYAGFYAISSTLTVQFGQLYHLDSTFQGLLFLPQAVGSLMSTFTNGIMLDKFYQHYAKKLGYDPNKKKQHDLTKFPIEKARLSLALPFMAANSIFTIAYGWMLHYEVHIAGPVVMLVFIAYTMTCSFNGFNVLGIDLNRHRAASASAAFNLARCLFGAGMTAVVNPMILAMGRGWCFTFTGLVQASLLPLMWICMQKGPQWRAEKAARVAAAAVDAEAEAQQSEKSRRTTAQA